MSEYRDEVRSVVKETRWTFWRVMPTFAIVVVSLGALGFVLNSAGLIGRTVVERKVFENSYQRDAAFQARIATDEATIAAINSQLQNLSLDSETKNMLEAQKRAAQVRIETAKRTQ